MDTIFMNFANSKTFDPHRLLDKVNLKRNYKYVALSNLSIYYTFENINISYKYNTFKISAPTFNEVFKLLDGSYSLSEIEDYIENITKKT